MENKIPCTVVILTLNSEKVLPRCLQSVSFADEILLVDGNSTDTTHAIASQYNARIIKQKETDEPNIRIDNFTEVRQKGIDAAKNDWIINIDSDEWFAPGTENEIRTIVLNGDVNVAMQAPDIIVLDDGLGQVIKHAWYYPRFSMLRLFNRAGDVTLMRDKKVHERWILGKQSKEVIAKNGVFFSMKPYAMQKEKTDYYLSLAYKEYQGKNISLWYLVNLIWYRNVRSILGIFARVFYTYLRYGFKDVLPFKYVLETLKYQCGLIKFGTKVFFEQKVAKK